MKNPMASAIDLVEAGDHQAIADYIAKARQAERFAQYFEWMMLHDMSLEYTEHVDNILNDTRYDKAYLCAVIDKARAASKST